jgi:hypothetical protein
LVSNFLVEFQHRTIFSRMCFSSKLLEQILFQDVFPFHSRFHFCFWSLPKVQVYALER